MSRRDPITSADNETFRRLLKLQQSSRERRKAGQSLLDGIHLLSAYLEGSGVPDDVVVSRSALENAELSTLLGRLDAQPIVLSDGLFRELSSVVTPTGVLAVVKTPRPQAAPQEPGPCVLLENLQDPGNVGSILRSAAAAGMREIYLSRESVHAWSPRVLRAGMGAHFALQIFEGVQLEELVGRFQGRVLAASSHKGVSIFEADLQGHVALLFGNEGAGISPALAERVKTHIRIPMRGQVESLNVAAAAAVCLFERVRQQVTARR